MPLNEQLLYERASPCRCGMPVGLNLLSSDNEDPSYDGSTKGEDLTLTPSPKMDDFRDANEYFHDIPLMHSDQSVSSLGSSCEDDDKFNKVEIPRKTIAKFAHKFFESRRTDENTDRNTNNGVIDKQFHIKPMGKKTVSNNIAGQPPLPQSATKRQNHEVTSPHGLHTIDMHFPQHPGSHQITTPHHLLPSAHPFQSAAYPQLKSLSSPVLKVFNQQPLRYFPPVNSSKKRDLKSESLEASTEGLREIRKSSMLRTAAVSLKSHSVHRSADSAESATSLQPIYVFHNMNTMQQRLGVPHATHGVSHSGILSNYYYYQNNPTVSLSNSNNEMIASTQAPDTQESENRQTPLKAERAKNVATAGDNHLTLLLEACIEQYDKIVVVLNNFRPHTNEIRQTKSSMGIALGDNNDGKTKSWSNQLMHHSMMRVSHGAKTETKGPLKSCSTSDHHPFSVPTLIVSNDQSLSNSKSMDSGHRAIGGTTSSSYNGDEYCDYEDIFNFEDRPSLDTSRDFEIQNDPSVLLMRYLDITSAYSEVLQLQSKECDALNLLLQSFACVAAFVQRNFEEPADALLPGYTKPAKISLEEPPIFALQQKIDRMLDDYHQQTEIHLYLKISLFQCLDRLAYHANMHLLYAVTNVIRRFTVLLKWNKMLDEAITVGKATVSLYQSMSKTFEEHLVDLVSAYSLLSSILMEKGSINEALLIDSKALALSTQLVTTTT